MQVSGFRLQVAGCRFQVAGFKFQVAGFKLSVVGCQLKVAACGLLLFSLFLFSAPRICAQSKPNIVIMLTDDQGYGDIGAHGNPYLKTPNIESIGVQG